MPVGDRWRPLISARSGTEWHDLCWSLTSEVGSGIVDLVSSKKAASGGDRQHGAVRAEDGRALDSTQLPSGTEDGTDQRPIDRPQADPSSRYHSILQKR